MEPCKARQFIALRGIVVRHDAFDVGEHGFHMLDHQPVIDAGLLFLRGLDGCEVLPLLLETGELRFIEDIGPGAWRAEVGVQALAAPCGLDEQDRPVNELLHVEAKSELRSDLGPVLARAEAGCQLACPHLIRAAER